MCDMQSIFGKEFDPRFLFTWKGTRDNREETYHSHDFLQVAFVMSGVGRCRIDGAVYELAEGDLMIINPGIMHQALIIEGNETPNTDFFVSVSDFQLEGLEENTLPLPENSPVLHTTGELRQRMFRICSSMDAENEARRQGQYYMMKSYATQILLLVIREQYEAVERMKGRTFESGNKKYVVEQIISYFEDHYHEKISLEQIAVNMYLSPFYISKIFKSETGDTPIRYLINIRLQRAKELLEQDEVSSIQEVAARVGYDDAYHFSKLFKKRYGISPSKVKPMLQTEKQ